ncbi:phosphatidate cytidylyltransferase [Chromobacterium haemolyticum]|uniref:Phosphatidate cytidylyltransferase n=1 Tax=Chromobacterium haemolyticum TaxID=394935 RepID=A0ABS3GP38_9NEIS|nr:phosphatidate cytidylyltransferase [Chromobacterium haemolyticum]MBK0415328.1 phosphatidate cytidylyltransferase [Chromobacterium haemolyticum]MBO0416709.1 phosphatidate cytidylyltransferase [Chromobacterium haemolyticum]MBO0500103.1 phosphatidate cytidylyltransferase [Chromobacterium haemolyticum]MDH0341177.1 phosphatidate cytidylyltransferase [Chromobacterium haemolyticum]BBH14237.1 phosphatidate cytidylyltransferase [Chromobacterium haemolyticum]
MFKPLLPQALIWALGAVFALLVIASVAVRVLESRSPQKNWLELKLRIRTWWWIVACFSLTLLGNVPLALVVFALISFLALKEYLTLCATRTADHVVLFWAYLSIPLQYYWLGIHWYGMFIIFIPVYIFLFLPMRMVLIGETQGFLKAAASLQWGLMICVFCLSHMAAVLTLPQLTHIGEPAQGAMLLFYLVALTQLNDVAQYLWGKAFGRRKVAPKVSPNKTLEGFLGGALTTCLLGWLLGPLLTPFSPLHAALAGLLIGVMGFIGDIVISAVKRDIGVKDSGRLLPGHGGVLDRLDSLTYTAPLFFHYVHYLYF